MPIYDQGYRRYEARSAVRQVRFWPITREALRLILAKRAFLVLLGASFLPFIVRAVQIYVVTQLPEAGRILPVDGRLFGEFLNQQIFFVLLLSVFGGAGLVARDLATGAILLYLSRPLTRRDYVAGKLGVLLVLNLAVTLLPGLALYGLGVAVNPSAFARWDRAWIAPAIGLHSLLIALALGLVALAISSLSKSARVAGIAFAGLILGLETARGVLVMLTRRPEAHLLSIQQDLKIVGEALFGLASRDAGIPAAYPLLVVAVVMVGCLAVLRARVRAVEIVG
jgi:ABC-2 type transport system permease protein